MTDHVVGQVVRFQGGLKDYLAEARETANGATAACAGSCAVEFALMEDVERLIASALGGVALQGDVVGNLLGMSGYSLYLGAARNALTGHPWTVYPLLRTALEAVCYWAKMESDPGLSSVWSARHADEDSRVRARRAFQSAVSDVVASLGGAEPESVGAHVREHYDSLIDFGAHPNPRALFSAVSLTEETSHRVINLAILEPLESGASRQSMIACVECGALMAAVIKCPPISKVAATECDISDVADVFRRIDAYVSTHNDRDAAPK